MEKDFIGELDSFLLNNPNCTQDEREEIIAFVNKIGVVNSLEDE